MGVILVTGGAGFIGSNLVARLISLGKQVRIIDNFSTGKWENIEDFKDDIDIVEGDIRNIVLTEKAMHDVEFVFHQAALTSIIRSTENPIATNQVNVQGTLNLLYLAKEMGVKRFIYASSSSVYGELESLPKQETMKPSPISPYAVSKLAGELYCKAFNKVYDLEVVILRYFNVFGPKQNPFSEYSAVIPKFIYAFKKRKSPIIYGDGEQTRDFTYVDNVVQGNILALRTPNLQGEPLFNIACGKRYSLNYMTDHMKSLFGSDTTVRYSKGKKGDVKHSLACIDKARRVLGYVPEITFEEGLQKTFAWYCDNY